MAPARLAVRVAPGRLVEAPAAWAIVLLVAALVAGACGSAPSAARRTTTTAAPSTVVTAPATTGPRTTVASSFPAVIVEAMAQFDPVPAGAEAPIELPAEAGYWSAETGGIGGQDNVTLVVTTSPFPVDSAQLSASNSTEIASFATTPTSSASTARGGLSQDENQSIDSCQGPSSSLTLTGGTAATSCSTVQGAAVNWRAGAWTVQVVTLGGSSPSTSESDHLASELRSGALPGSDVGGFLSVVVPATASAGRSDTADIEWTLGADLYQVRTSDDPDGAVAVAEAMRPYPG